MARPVLLIAGGSRGIGACTAGLAGARGYDVAVNYKSNVKAAGSVVDAVKAAGGKTVAIQGDMVTEETIERVFDQATKELGPITHFVHCAGIGGKNSRLDVASAATIREVIDVNLYGGILCARAAVRRMSTASGGKGGSIVMLGSIASVTAAPANTSSMQRQKEASTRSRSGLPERWRRRASASTRSARDRPKPRSTNPGGSSGLRRCCRWPGQASRKKSPKRSCSCCRMRRLISAAQSSMFLGLDSAIVHF